MRQVSGVSGLLAVCVLFVLSVPHSVVASDVLTIAPGARPAGMGDCFVALADDASAAFWNPGGLPFIEDRVSFVGMKTELLPDWGGFDYWYGAVAYRAGPFANFALSYTSLKWPEMQFVWGPDDPDDYVMFAPSERVLLFSYALMPLENLGLGVSVKHVHTEELPGDHIEGTDGTASAVAFDLGALYRLPHTAGAWDAVLGIGANVQHLGGDLELDGELFGNPQKGALPRNLKLGASYRVGKGPALQTLFCFEYNRSLVDDENSLYHSDEPVYGLGLEVETSITALAHGGTDAGEPGTRDVIAVRLGYVHDDEGDVTGYSYGFGIGVEGEIGSLTFDVANVPQCCDLTRPWRYGLTVSLAL